MGAAIGQTLSNAVGVAISPIPVIALILMLFSNKAKANSLSFVVGWVGGLVAAGAIVLAIGFEQSADGSNDSNGYLKIAIGALFLVLAVRNWRMRPKDGEEPEMPAWMASIDDFSPVKAFGMAFLLAAVNPKNLGLTVAASSSISAAGLESGEEYIVLGVFVLLASVSVIVPVVFYLAMGPKAEAPLNSAKQWLITNNHTVMAVLLLVLGAKVLGDGISALS